MTSCDIGVCVCVCVEFFSEGARLSTIFEGKRKRGATEWGNGGGIFCTLIYSYASDSGVARIC